jgi:hypothetical protein
MNFINKDELTRVLMENHSKFINSTQIFKQTLLDVRDSHYQTVIPKDPSVSTKTKVIISKFDIRINNQLEIWVEFSVPRQDGNVVGTHIYNINLDGTFELKETHGVIFSN